MPGNLTPDQVKLVQVGAEVAWLTMRIGHLRIAIEQLSEGGRILNSLATEALEADDKAETARKR